MARGDEDGLAALVSDAESDPRMKEMSGEPDEEREEEEGDGDELDDCLNRAFDAKEKGDRAGFVSAMRQAIKGY